MTKAIATEEDVRMMREWMLKDLPVEEMIARARVEQLERCMRIVEGIARDYHSAWIVSVFQERT